MYNDYMYTWNQAMEERDRVKYREKEIGSIG